MTLWSEIWGLSRGLGRLNVDTELSKRVVNPARPREVNVTGFLMSFLTDICI